MRSNYIASPKYLVDVFLQGAFRGRWKLVRRVPLSRIRVDPSLFSYRNHVTPEAVADISDDFHRTAWYPVMVNPEFFLLDGQHRLAAAKKMGLRYIDAVVDAEGASHRKVARHHPRRKHNP